MSARGPWRDDTGTTPATAMPRCPDCGTPFFPAGRQVYCSTACRKRAFRRRYAAAALPVPVPAGTPRREHTVYECPDCGERRLGVQRCPDCGTFGRSAGLGGACPHCGEPVTVADLELAEAGRR